MPKFAERASFMDKLTLPQYVIRMNWHRMSQEKRVTWARNMKTACYRTIAEIERWLADQSVSTTQGGGD